jgi:hypothetical protein
MLGPACPAGMECAGPEAIFEEARPFAKANLADAHRWRARILTLARRFD